MSIRLPRENYNRDFFNRFAHLGVEDPRRQQLRLFHQIQCDELVIS